MVACQSSSGSSSSPDSSGGLGTPPDSEVFAEDNLQRLVQYVYDEFMVFNEDPLRQRMGDCPETVAIGVVVERARDAVVALNLEYGVDLRLLSLEASRHPRDDGVMGASVEVSVSDDWRRVGLSEGSVSGTRWSMTDGRWQMNCTFE